LDATGVPYKNRIAEYERKLAEAAQLNQQYQQVLGQYSQPLAVQRPDPASKFDAETIAFVREEARKIAAETGHKMMTRMDAQEQLRDPELFAEADKVFRTLKSNPLWSTVDEVLLTQHAVESAKATLNARKLQAATQNAGNAALTAANRAQAPVGGLPPTTGGGPIPTQDSQFVRDFMSNPESRGMFKKMFPQLSLDSPEGQAKLRKIATREEGYQR